MTSLALSALCALVAALTLLAQVRPGLALTCYSCATGAGIDPQNCKAPGSSTPTTNCSSSETTCLTTTERLVNGITRSCNLLGSSNGCTLGVCTYTCSSNLCNTQGLGAGSVTGNIALTATLAIAAWALVKGAAAL